MGTSESRCEVCETRSDLAICALDDQPMLWFCRTHLAEHQRDAHGAKPAPTPPSSLTEEQRLNLDVIQGVNGFLRDKLPWGERSLLGIIDTLTREIEIKRNTIHDLRTQLQAARFQSTIAQQSKAETKD